MPIRLPCTARQACAALALTLLACGPGEADRRPNVVLVIIDTLRADKLGSYGAPASASPALDRLAATGVQLDLALAQASWTLPSTGSLLTARYPRALGLYVEEVQRLPDSADTLAELLSVHGYATFGITANPHLNETFNFQQGFDTYVESDVVTAPSRDLVPEGKTFYRDAPLETAGKIFGRTLDWVDARTGAAPAYLQINVMDVHQFRPAPRKGRSAVAAIEAGYLKSVRITTDALAGFVASLRERPGWRDALFIVTSDHGEGLADHPDVHASKRHGSLLYDSQVRVPWIMFAEGWQPAHARVARPVRLLDLVPTVLDMLSLPIPPALDGVSVRALFDDTGAEPHLPEYFVTETHYRGRTKLGVHGREWQYFDNRADHTGLPRHELQRRHRAANGFLTDESASEPQRVKDMKRHLAEWESRHGATPPTLVERALLPGEESQLRALGYLE